MLPLIEIVQAALGVKFDRLTPALALRLGMKLVGIVPDLLNLPADHHLPAGDRLLIEDAIAEFETEVGL